jgi:integrase
VDRKTGKSVVRYQVTVDTGISPQTGRRQQARRRYATERDARTALAEITDATAKGQFVTRSTLTVERVCADYLASRRRLRASSRAKLEYDLGPLRERYGQLPVQRLTKAHIDALVGDLVAGGTKTAKGRQRRPWSADSINKVIAATEQVLADAKAQGIVSRNVAELVNRVNKPHKPADTYTEAEVQTLLASITDNRSDMPGSWRCRACGALRSLACAGPTSTLTRERCRSRTTGSTRAAGQWRTTQSRRRRAGRCRCRTGW